MTRLDGVRNEEIRRVLKQEVMMAQVKEREGWRDKVMESHGSLVEEQ